MYVCEEDVHEKESKERVMKIRRAKRNEREKKAIRKKKRDKIKKERRENINLFIQTDKHTDRQTDGQTDRHKPFIDMRYYTEQHSKSNSIEQNRIE